MIIGLTVTLIGGLFGWVYGGNLLGLVRKYVGGVWAERLDAVDKILLYIAYGATFIFLMPILNFYSFLALAASQWARRAISWGKYIGALIHGKITFDGEHGVTLVDQVIFANGEKVDYLKLRCIAALGIIGAIGGLALTAGLFIAYSLMGAAAPFSAILIPVATSLMGVIYWACIEASGLIHGQDEDGKNDGWGYGETAFSAYSFLAVYLLAIN